MVRWLETLFAAAMALTVSSCYTTNGSPTPPPPPPPDWESGSSESSGYYYNLIGRGPAVNISGAIEAEPGSIVNSQLIAGYIVEDFEGFDFYIADFLAKNAIESDDPR